LSQFNAQAAQEVAAFDVSRIVAEINEQTAYAQATGAFTASIIRDANLREGLLSGLASAYAAIPSNLTPLTTFNYDELLRTIMGEFDEVGLIRSESFYNAAVSRTEAWLETFPPNVRALVIAIISTLLVFALEKAVDVGSEVLNSLPALQEKHIAPESREPISGNMCP